MNLLKKILIGIAVLIILLLILSFVLPKELHVTKSKEVDAPVAIAYNVVNDFTAQKDWNPWKAADPTMELTMGDRTAGEGATYSWTSENSGKGSQLITRSVKNETVETEVNFEGMGKGIANYSFVPNGNKTTVTWDFKSESSRPMNLFNLFAKMQLGKTFDQGIENIGKLANKRYKNSEYNGYIIKEETVDGKTYLISRAEMPSGNVNTYYAQNLPGLFQKIQELGLTMEGKPSILYFNMLESSGKVDAAAALPLNEEMALSDDVNASIINLESGRALVVDYYGNYDNVNEAHRAINDYMNDRGLLKRYPIVQEFVTDTAKETDSSKWLTRIIYFIAR